jgi:hypothetical protein
MQGDRHRQDPWTFCRCRYLVHSMKAYSRPVLIELGSMAHVTRKSGQRRDPETLDRAPRNRPPVCDFMPWLPPCN